MRSKSAEIASRMDAVRGKKRDRIAELSHESNRLANWREHVRSAPLLTLAASVAIGAFGVMKLRSSSPSVSMQDCSGLKDGQAKLFGTTPVQRLSSRVATTLWSIALPAVSGMIRQRLAATLNDYHSQYDSEMREANHDRQNV